MHPVQYFDVMVIGGGIAGSTMAGVLARGGLRVMAVEREARFRDRVRGEATWPWGVAEARRAGLGDLLDAQSIAIRGIRVYDAQEVVVTKDWGTDTLDSAPTLGFSHPGLQEAAFAWAASQGATMLRPAKATGFALHGEEPCVTVEYEGREHAYRSRLVIGADGKRSGVRSWAGGTTLADPEHHRFGGVLVAGMVTDWEYDQTGLQTAHSTTSINWFAIDHAHMRLYVQLPAQRLRETGIDRSFEQLIAFASAYAPDGTFAAVTQAGPIGFFPNNCVWSSQISGNAVVLIGDAAGAPDPTQGHGTALLFHDVRLLSELLLSERDWPCAIGEYVRRRERYYDVLLHNDRWQCLLKDEGVEAARLRERHQRAKAQDPTLGGYAVMQAYGPDGLVADETARRRFFDSI